VNDSVWAIGYGRGLVSQQNADIADTLQLRDVAIASIFVFLYMGVHWRQLANTTEPSMCGSDAACYRITLTTCYYYKCNDYSATVAKWCTVHFI